MKRSRHLGAQQKRRHLRVQQKRKNLNPPKNESKRDEGPVVDHFPTPNRVSNILIATPMWKRPKIFEFWAERIKSLGCDVLVVGSEGEKSRQLVEKYNFIYIEHPNEPLSAKFNARIDYFLLNPQYTHILLLGSDDIICPRTLAIIEKHIQQYDIVNWSDIYFYEWKSKRTAYYPGHPNRKKGAPLAPGQCISRCVIESLGGKLWESPPGSTKRRWFPDVHLRRKLQHFRNQITLSCKKEGCRIVDVKGNLSLTSFNTMLKYARLVYCEKVECLMKNIRMGENVSPKI